jgi:hypothetical protein
MRALLIALDHGVIFLLLASLNVPNVAEAVWHRSPSVDLIACDLF